MQWSLKRLTQCVISNQQGSYVSDDTDTKIKEGCKTPKMCEIFLCYVFFVNIYQNHYTFFYTLK